MTDIAFRRTSEDEALIMADGETVGYLYRQSDVPGGDVTYIAHLDEDPRGFRRIHERGRICEVVTSMVETHPFR